MDRAEVERIVTAELPALQRQLGLDRWRIKIGYRAWEADEHGSQQNGECTRLLDYDCAFVTINHEACATEADVISILRHELFHVVLAPFDLYSAGVGTLSLKEPAAELLERLEKHSIERCVAALERMWEGMSA